MLPPCSSCGRERGDRPHENRPNGWCNACYQRWLRHGRPDSGPPPPDPGKFAPSAADVAAARAVRSASLAARLEQFRLLDRDKLLSDQQIAWAMSVTRRTVQRYRAAERAAGRGWWKNAPK